MNFIMWKGLFGLVVVNTVLFKVNQCQDLIGPSPKQTALIGQPQTLTCSKASNVSNQLAWFDDTLGTNVQLYLGTTKLSFDAKYDNFGVISNTIEQLDLDITDIAVEDEGTFICQIAGTARHEQVILTVEVRSSSLDMTQGGDTSLVTVIEGKSSEIKCTATGARPAVNIDWYHTNVGGSETMITDGVSQVDTPNGDTFDSASILMYDATKDYNGGSLRCETTGQEVAESRQDTASINVLYVPIVEVQYANDTVICTSDANPVAISHVIIANGTMEYTPSCNGWTCTLYLEVDYDTDVRCNATNLVGTGIDDTVAVPGVTPQPATTRRMTPSPTDATQPSTTIKMSTSVKDATQPSTTIKIPTSVKDATQPSTTIRMPTSVKDTTQPSTTTRMPTSVKGETHPPTTKRMTTSVNGGGGGDPISIAITVGVVLGSLLCICFIIIILLGCFLGRNKKGTTNNTPEMIQTSPTHALNVPQAYIELHSQAHQVHQYESTIQQVPAENPNTSQTLMNLNPQTQEDTTSQVELNGQSQQGVQNRAYEEIE